MPLVRSEDIYTGLSTYRFKFSLKLGDGFGSKPGFVSRSDWSGEQVETSNFDRSSLKIMVDISKASPD